jgi:hypothetical protein
MLSLIALDNIYVDESRVFYILGDLKLPCIILVNLIGILLSS